MNTHVRVWQSFSCNNSSSFRLVARFENAVKAAEVAAELQSLRADDPANGEQSDPIDRAPRLTLGEDQMPFGVNIAKMATITEHQFEA